MKIRLLVLFSLLNFLFLVSNAQSKKHGLKDPKIVLLVEQADEQLLAKSYFNAIDLYTQSLEGNLENVYVNHQLAWCYYKTRDFKNASRFFNNVAGYDNEDNREFPYDLFYLAESIKSMGEYENAKVHYIKFYKQKIRTLEFKEFSKYAKQGIKGCDNSILGSNIATKLNFYLSIFIY